MINYSEIYSRVDKFLQTRKGLSNPKNPSDYKWFLRELAGLFCGLSHENNLDTKDIVDYLDLVENHRINNIVDDGKLHNVTDLIDPRITSHPLYNITEFTLMNYKPGNVQVGPGEFFLCFYDCDSVFGIDNQAGYDVIVDGTTTELKKLGSNFTTPELFDKYAASDKVDRLMVIKPVSDAKKPRQRSQIAVVTFSKMDWREAFYHHPNKPGKNGKIQYNLRLAN